MRTKMFVAILALVGVVGMASATDKVEVRVVKQQNVKVVKEVQVKEVPVIVKQQKVVVKEVAPVVVQEVTEVKTRRVGPIRGFFRGLFGLDNEVVQTKTTRVVR